MSRNSLCQRGVADGARPSRIANGHSRRELTSLDVGAPKPPFPMLIAENRANTEILCPR